MMNKRILKLEAIGFIFTSVLGTLMHFFYEWSGNNTFVGLFCPVNESPYEHLKLLFFPFLIWTFVENIKLSNNKFNIFTSKLIGILLGMYVTLSVFYIFEGATGKTVDAVNIASFFIGVLIAYIISYIITVSSKGKGIINGISFAMLIIIGISFIFFTFYPVKIPLFMDPQKLTYGITKQF